MDIPAIQVSWTVPAIQRQVNLVEAVQPAMHRTQSIQRQVFSSIRDSGLRQRTLCGGYVSLTTLGQAFQAGSAAIRQQLAASGGHKLLLEAAGTVAHSSPADCRWTRQELRTLHHVIHLNHLIFLKRDRLENSHWRFKNLRF